MPGDHQYAWRLLQAVSVAVAVVLNFVHSFSRFQHKLLEDHVALFAFWAFATLMLLVVVPLPLLVPVWLLVALLLTGLCLISFVFHVWVPNFPAVSNVSRSDGSHGE